MIGSKRQTNLEDAIRGLQPWLIESGRRTQVPAPAARARTHFRDVGGSRCYRVMESGGRAQHSPGNTPQCVNLMGQPSCPAWTGRSHCSPLYQREGAIFTSGELLPYPDCPFQSPLTILPDEIRRPCYGFCASSSKILHRMPHLTPVCSYSLPNKCSSRA